jgi:phosphatidylserine decarboxylase
VTGGLPGRPKLADGTPAWLVALGRVLPLTLLAAVAGPRLARRPALLAAGAALGGLAFFRDPERATPPVHDAPADALLAAADGVVTAIDQLADGRVRVCTYMRLRDVHVNRSPADGVVRSVVHRPGGHLPALSKSSNRNERMEWVIDTADGPLELVQIAGALARRIVAYRAPGDQVARGERIGLIRFGSRVDVVLPPGTEPAVVKGQRLRAGRSRLSS